jgi:hypothetical protein
MSGLIAKYFGPLSKEYCLYFYALSIFFGVMFVVALLILLFSLFKFYKKVNTMVVINMAALLANIFLAYFVNRLLHTMCVGSIH